MSNLDHILNEIQDLSPTELQELKSYLQVVNPTDGTPAREQPVKVPSETGDEFDADLDAVIFSAPPLPSTFSRADIYDDHD